MGEASTSQLAKRLSRAPHDVALRLRLGRALTRSRRFEEAVALYEEGVRLAPEQAALRLELAESLVDCDRLEPAVAVLRELLAQQPDHADAQASLGGVLLRLQRAPEAKSILSRCASLLPEDAVVRELLAEAHAACGEVEPALRAYEQARSLGRETRRVLFGMASLSTRLERFAQADALFEQASALPGDEPVPWHNWGKARFELGDVSDAVDAFRSSLAQGVAASLVELAVILPGDPRAAPSEWIEARRQLVRATALPAEPWSPPKQTRAKLRVGYLSSFFARANYMKPVDALLSAHRAERVEVELFHDGPGGAELADRLEGTAVTRVHGVGGTSNADLVRAIRGRALDVLVDLNGYSATNRLPALGVRLARVGVGWFNHYASAALPAIDVLVGDAHTFDASEQDDYAERVHRLRRSYLRFRVRHEAPAIVPPPCLARGAPTFGSLCSAYKITPQVVAAWARILRGAPGARLLLANAGLRSAEAAARMRDAFARQGVDPARLELRGPAPHLAYLANYDDIDLALDAWPYNGGTTTTEALWQGVPVLCFRGDRWAARTSASLVADTPFCEFLLGSEAELVEAAIRWASDPELAARLAPLRASARERLLASPVCDVEGLAAELEDLYAALVAERARVAGGPDGDPHRPE